jgi:hypothetical protein
VEVFTIDKEIEYQSNMGTDEKLLFIIQNQLKKLNDKLDVIIDSKKPKEIEKDELKKTETKKKPTTTKKKG